MVARLLDERSGVLPVRRAVVGAVALGGAAMLPNGGVNNSSPSSQIEVRRSMRLESSSIGAARGCTSFAKLLT